MSQHDRKKRCNMNKKTIIAMAAMFAAATVLASPRSGHIHIVHDRHGGGRGAQMHGGGHHHQSHHDLAGGILHAVGAMIGLVDHAIYGYDAVVVSEPAPVVVQQTTPVVVAKPVPAVVQQPAPVVVARPAPVVVAPQPVRYTRPVVRRY